MISYESLKNRFRQILSLEESPHKVSLAFAIGTFIGFSPTFGLHTISALAAARLLKLNLAVMIAGTLVNNPWTIVFIYGSSICFGSFVLGNSESCYPHGFSEVELLVFLKSVPFPFFTGTIILGSIVAFINYYVLARVLISRRVVK